MNKQTNQSALLLVNNIKKDLEAILDPPPEGLLSESQQVVAFSLVKGTRGYIEKVTNQINGCYEKGWFDACAVMIRRLIETLIIECFESYGISNKIKNPKGDFYYLSDLINLALVENSWNLGRNVRSALPKLKDIGDKSAHSRRFNAHLPDVKNLIGDIRVVVQELIYLSKLK